MTVLTPVERRGAFLVKRDDLFSVAGVRGGKSRTCWHLAQGAVGLVTAGSRSSPQVNIVAHVARRLGVPCRVHVPIGALGDEVSMAKAAGATVVQHRPGYNSVIVARARQDAISMGWNEIPFGMECQAAVDATAEQVQNLPWGQFRRIVMPVGSGMSLAGVLTGLQRYRPAGVEVRVFGVVVGADPTKRLNRYAPERWSEMVDLHTSPWWYDARLGYDLIGLTLDPIYEAKCFPYILRDDLVWVVGVRKSVSDRLPAEMFKGTVTEDADAGVRA